MVPEIYSRGSHLAGDVRGGFFMEMVVRVMGGLQVKGAYWKSSAYFFPPWKLECCRTPLFVLSHWRELSTGSMASVGQQWREQSVIANINGSWIHPVLCAV